LGYFIEAALGPTLIVAFVAFVAFMIIAIGHGTLAVILKIARHTDQGWMGERNWTYGERKMEGKLSARDHLRETAIYFAVGATVCSALYGAPQFGRFLYDEMLPPRTVDLRDR